MMLSEYRSKNDLSISKFKAGIFDDWEIRQFVNDTVFVENE